MTRENLIVYFDGACPVCRREIAFYKRHSEPGQIGWVDVSRGETEMIDPDLSRAGALERLHVRKSDGVLVSGAAAFVALWREIPQFAWLGTIASAPRALRILEIAYAGFLKIRSWWRSERRPHR